MFSFITSIFSTSVTKVLKGIGTHGFLKKSPNSFNIATQKPGYELTKLQAMISAGKLNAEIAPLLCDYWFKDLWSREEDALKKQLVSEQTANSLAQNCKMAK